jgi:hypothetical protein
MTFEELKKANKTIVPVEIKGKKYAEVNQRIMAFRSIFPEGFIKTEIVSLADNVVVIRAEVGNDGKVLGTGTAFEEQSANYINKTSYIENCETSAVGRALGMAGFGTDCAVASAEEMQGVAKTREADEKNVEFIQNAIISEDKQMVLKKMCETEGVDIKKLCEKCNIKDFSEMTEKVFQNINAKWNKVKESCK